MKQIIFLILTIPFWVLAENQDNTEWQILQLEKQLARIQQESQATFQQFQMIQELRRNDMQSSPLSVPTPSMSATSVPIPRYEDMVQREQDRHKRIEEYTAELDRLYTYYKELDEKRKAIIEEIDQLKQSQIPAQPED